jgi:hypothetical protein
MDTKTKNFFKALTEIALFNVEIHPQIFTETMSHALNYDFDTAVNLWEYLLEKYEKVFCVVKNANTALSTDTLKLFYDKSLTKTLKMLSENAVIKKYLLTLSNAAFDEVIKNTVAQAIMGNRTENADEFLKFLCRHEEFGKIMIDILVIIREKLLLKDSKTLRLTNKQATYLNAFAAKIKTSDKAVVLQRIKEMS